MVLEFLILENKFLLLGIDVLILKQYFLIIINGFIILENDFSLLGIYFLI